MHIATFVHFQGLNFQLSAVLLSLGFYTFAEDGKSTIVPKHETVFSTSKETLSTMECLHRREGLSQSMSAQTSESEKKTLETMSLQTNILVALCNWCFSLLAICHLAYLGAPFTGNTDSQGYSWRHTLETWSNFHFSSHIIAVITFCISLFFYDRKIL